MRWLAIAVLAASSAQAQDFFTLKGHGGPIMDIAVSPSGQIATASFDNAVGLWDGTDPTWLDGHAAAVTTLDFWSDGLIASGGDDFKLRLWQTRDGSGRILGSHDGKIADIALAPDGETIATASWDGSIRLWLLSGSGTQVLTERDVISRELSGHRAAVNAVTFSDNGKTLYSGSADGTIRKWQYEGDALVSSILASHGFGVNQLIVNETDSWLAYGAVDGSTRFIDPQSGALIRDYTLERRPILALAYDPVGRQLAVGDGDGYIMMIDTVQMQISRDFRATQAGPIWALAFSPDGQNIHAAGIENIMYSWPVATMREHGQMDGTTRSFLEDPATLGNGERQFKRKCSICHTVTEGSARRAGPSLHDLFGRQAGTVADYSYSETLTGSDIVWSADTIDALFDQGPDHYIPGTKMPMQRIVIPQDRIDLIDYLRDATAQGGN